MPENKLGVDEKNAMILSRMDEMQKKFERIHKTCRMLKATAVSGAILIIVVLGVFANSFVSFVRNFDKKALTYELKDRGLALALSNEARQLLYSVQDKLLPDYGVALIKESKNSAPLLVSDIQKIKKDVVAYLENQVKAKLLNNLASKLSDSEAHIIAERVQSDVYAGKLTSVLDFSTKKILERLPEILDKRIDPMVVRLASLNDAFNVLFEDMERSGEFEGISPGASGEIENRLIENLLELIIYHINPEKGKKLASQ